MLFPNLCCATQYWLDVKYIQSDSLHPSWKKESAFYTFVFKTVVQLIFNERKYNAHGRNVTKIKDLEHVALFTDS